MWAESSVACCFAAAILFCAVIIFFMAILLFNMHKPERVYSAHKSVRVKHTVVGPYNVSRKG